MALQPTNSAPQAIILAAGQGKRMAAELGDRPKVLYEAAGQPMVRWVVEACRQAGVGRCIVVVGYQAEKVKQSLANEPDVVFVMQEQQLGTGHATRMAEPVLAGQSVDVFVLAGDGPLIRARTLRQMLDVHRQQGADATLATAVIDDPTGYGRVLRKSDGSFGAIVEHKDATGEQRAIREVYPSYACFRSEVLFKVLGQLRNNNSQGEYYVTEAPNLLKGQGRKVVIIDAVPPEDVLGVNTPKELAQVDAILRRRLAAERADRASPSREPVAREVRP
jgi:bifunctional UDP-N-acetylglucosamine pyrophosphorylase / glucosamine-1-phosphate N-acetyltransferase